jgi:uncharacterized membrane protein
MRNSIGSRAVRTRFATRLAVVALAVVVPVIASAAPALAGTKVDDGSVPGPSLGVGNTILLFVVIPLGVFLIIAGLATLPSALSRPRYRPGKPWDHDSAWIGGPAAAAVTPGAVTDGVARPDDSSRGGASAEW